MIAGDSAYYSAAAFLDITTFGSMQIIAAGEGQSINFESSTEIDTDVGGNSVVSAFSAGIFIEGIAPSYRSFTPCTFIPLLFVWYCLRIYERI